MKILAKEQIVFFDIDSTLILENQPSSMHDIKVEDPLDSTHHVWVQPHTAMIRLLKEEYSRGSTVIVWSRGGYQWAANVIKALGLEEMVNMAMSKPMVYFDDMPIEKWLPYRVYLEPGTKYRS
jgi:hypothetical protein